MKAINTKEIEWDLNNMSIRDLQLSLVIEPVERCKLNCTSNYIIKRSMDIVLGSILALISLPVLFPLLAVIIKLESKGPVFFIQKRTGLDKKTFNCIKFRSMVVNENANRLQVRPNDKRITRSGKFLRNYYLDELPQLINVIKGEMSLVGPRPHMLRHNVLYARIINNYHERHKVKPGMTGLAQMRGYHGMICTRDDLINRVTSDIDYIRNWSLLGDLRIFFGTLLHVIKTL